MGVLLDQILKSPGVINLLRFIGGLGFPSLYKKADQTSFLMAPPDLGVLNCRVRLTRQKTGNWLSDAFGVEICGSLHAPGDMHNVAVRVFIKDVTEGSDKVKEVIQRRGIKLISYAELYKN